MNKLVIILLLIINVSANNLEHYISGNIEYSYIIDNTNNANQLDVKVNNDILYGRHGLSFSPGFYMYDNDSYNSIVKEDVSKIRAIYLNELYYTYYTCNKLKFSVGNFPFRKGSFYEYSFNNNRERIGLYSITDITLQGIIATYANDKHTIQIGSVGFEKYFTSYKDYDKGNGNITFDSYKDSGMNFGIYKYKDNKLYLELQLMDIYQYLNGVKIIDTNNAAVGISFNDEKNTGRTYYTILSYSSSTGDTSSLSPIGSSFSTDIYHFDKFKSSGYYYLIGIKQELDNVLFNSDIVLGAELSYRSPGYHSLLAGRPISPHSYGDIGYFANIYAGIRINKNNMFKIRYFHYDNNGLSTKYGLSTESTSSFITDKDDKYDAIILQWYYDF